MVMYYQSGLVQKQLTKPNSENVPVNTDPNFANAHRIGKNIKIVVPLKHISNFFRNFELPLINGKLFMHTENTNKFSEILSKGFERTVVWNEYKSKIEIVTIP